MDVRNMLLLAVGTWLASACGGGVSGGECNPACGACEQCHSGSCVPDPVCDAGTDGTGDADGGADADADTDITPDGVSDGALDADVAADVDVVDECPAPLVRCDADCVDVSGDAAHCGSCATACGTGESCVSGICGGRWPSCDPGYVDCGLRDCRDVSADPDHCGGCDVGCAGLEYCRDGACVCRPGLTRCGGSCVDIRSDPSHCGGCGAACGRVCVDGACTTAAACGLTVCDDTACVDLRIDPRHCGDCGEECAGDQICFGRGCWDYEPAVGCASCGGCGVCRGETCCETALYGVICVDADVGCP